MSPVQFVTFVAYSALGTLFGAYALVKVQQKWSTVNKTTKGMWYFQVALTPLCGLCMLWIIFIFGGLIIQISREQALLLKAGCALSFPNAIWLILEGRTKAKGGYDVI